MLVCVSSHNFAHETAGAARIRHSLLPLIIEGQIVHGNLGQTMPREGGRASVVRNSNRDLTTSLRGALATKQSILPLRGEMDFFASLAMTALGRRASPPQTRHCPPDGLSYGLPFAGLIFYGGRGYTPRELDKSIKIKGLAEAKTFGGCFDAL